MNNVYFVLRFNIIIILARFLDTINLVFMIVSFLAKGLPIFLIIVCIGISPKTTIIVMSTRNTALDSPKASLTIPITMASIKTAVA